VYRPMRTPRRIPFYNLQKECGSLICNQFGKWRISWREATYGVNAKTLLYRGNQG
jgi:hypothetical protein